MEIKSDWRMVIRIICFSCIFIGMKQTLLLFALSSMSYACQRKSKQQDTKEQLEKTMAGFLYHHQAGQGAKLHFAVQDVTWFEEPAYYICEFKITMTLPDGRDTTGIMKEKVSKDPMAIMRSGGQTAPPQP